MTRRFHGICVIATALLSPWVIAAAYSAEDPLDTVVVTGSPESVRREVHSFVFTVTGTDGELVGRWRDYLCPMVVGLAEAQTEFIRLRLIEVQNAVRRRNVATDRKCSPNLFIIITDDAAHVLAVWKERDPGMFRWKSPENVSRSNGTGPVRTWHNAIELPSDGGPLIQLDGKPAQGRLKDSRIQASAAEYINASVVLVDTRAAGKVTLAQIADYVTMVSLAQVDLSADLGGINSILKLFAQPRPDVPPASLTEWDHAFLNGIYRATYSPVNQRREIAGRMERELAPR